MNRRLPGRQAHAWLVVAALVALLTAGPAPGQSPTSPGAVALSGETAATAFVGVIQDDAKTVSGSRPPTANRPVEVGSWTEFVSAFGDRQPGTRGGSAEDATAARNLRLAVHGFFANGGTRAWIVRVPTASGLADLRRPLGTLNSVDVDLVAVPGAVSARQHDAILDHVEAAGDRVALLDGQPSPSRVSAGDVRASRRNSDRAVLLFPWITIHDRQSRATVVLPPSGHVAGVIARNDRRQGVHEAPANLPVSDAAAPERQLSRSEVSGLASNGVILLLDGSGASGVRTWGARTLGGDANGEFRYVNVRRTVDQVRKQVLERNPASCQAARADAELLLERMWRSGVLQGATPSDAWFARCETDGLLLGLSILRPTEFISLRIPVAP